ncbi:MAG TPA: hypothetical protein VLA88_05435 [Candidatus Saccharimonadales bacterium]|nr:hypothetical protein [Candidatus Saccharimonadales bacterium]
MKISLQPLARKVRSMKMAGLFVAAAVTAAVSVSGSAFATSPGPKYFDVAKGSPQAVCYKQLGDGWKKLGFKNLDHCLRYVSTPAPEVKSDCNGGWWYVYGFKSIGHCKLWVTMHGGGGYDGDDHPEDQF